MNDSVDETVLVRYLLGDLPANEQVRVEERAFSDREYLGIVEAVEADLIDAYVRGELSPAQRQQFEHRFLESEERRTKVEFARALTHVAPSMRAAVAVAPAPAMRGSWSGFWTALWGPNHARRVAFAAALAVLAAALSWQTISTIRLRGRVTELETAQRNQQNREEALKRTADDERARAENLAAQLQRDAAQPGSSLPAVASLVLIPGVSRSAGSAARLVVAESAQLAHIEIPLEPRDQYARFRVELRTRSGEEILTRNNLRAVRSSTGRAIVLDVPASALTTTDYELTLQGVADGRPVDVGYSYFTVQKQ
jgi:hypothetical protein